MVLEPDVEVEAQTKLKDFQDIFSLDGKVVVITGGSRGLGLHAASGFVVSHTTPLLAPTLDVAWRTPINSFSSSSASSKLAAQKSTSPLAKRLLARLLARH